jgi:hypothetical protein
MQTAFLAFNKKSQEQLEDLGWGHLVVGFMGLHMAGSNRRGATDRERKRERTSSRMPKYQSHIQYGSVQPFHMPVNGCVHIK